MERKVTLRKILSNSHNTFQLNQASNTYLYTSFPSPILITDMVNFKSGLTTKRLELDVSKYNAQYNNLELKKFDFSHDRFLIIDNEIYHIGASLKDLGKKWFAFRKMDKQSLKILDKLNLLEGLPWQIKKLDIYK